VALVVGLLISAAVAGASWTPPATVTSGGPLLYEPRLFAGPAGELLSWSYSAGLAPHQTESAGYAVGGAGRPFAPARPLPHGFNGRPLVDLGDGHLA